MKNFNRCNGSGDLYLEQFPGMGLLCFAFLLRKRFLQREWHREHG